jgi:hypothetical protein
LSSCALSWMFSASALSSWWSRVLTAGLCMSMEHKQDRACQIGARASGLDLAHKVAGALPSSACTVCKPQAESTALNRHLHQHHHLQDSPA